MKHKLSKKLSEKPFGLLPVLFRRAQTANSKLNVLLYELWQAWFCFPFLIQLLIVYVLKPLCRWQRAQARISVISLYFRRSLYMHAVEPRYLELPALSDLNQFPLDLLLLFSHSYSVISNSVISNSPLSRTIFCFPWPKSTLFISNYNYKADRQTSESVKT